jgi:prepilin-type N-terminal cleavage/methylation domain-containing protein
MQAPIRRRLGDERGFSLLEVLIALSILAVGLLAMAAVQIQALKFGRVGRHTSDAALVARNEMERLQRLDWDDADVAPTGGWTLPDTWDQDMVTTGGTETEQTYAFRRRVVDVVAGDVKSIDVQVQWNEPNRPNRVFTISSLKKND